MKQLKLVLPIFIVVGIALLIGSIFLWKSSLEFTSNGIKTTGTIIDLDVGDSDGGRAFYPIIVFNTLEDNSAVMFRSSYGSSSFSNDIGNSIDIIYPKDNPKSAVINSAFGLYGSGIFISGFGVLFLLAGIIPLIIMKISKNKGTRLIREGSPITIKISEVIINDSISVNGSNPFQIIADKLDKATNSITRYKSKNIFFDPTPYLTDENVTVYIDKNNPKKYYMDISFLPTIKK